jgi:ribose transport system substrate-binding protein
LQVKRSGGSVKLTTLSEAFLITALLALILVPEACNPRKRPVYAVVPKGTAVIHWQTVHAGAVAASRESGVDIEYNGPAVESDFARQIIILDDFINQHVDGILLAPGDRDALVPAIRRAKRAGIPLTIVDSGAHTDDYVSFVGTDNYAGGVLAAKRLAEILGGSGRIIMTAGIAGGEATLARERGFLDTLTKHSPDVKLVAWQYGMCDRARSLAVTEDMLTANPGVSAIFASNESSSVGAAQAVKGRGFAHNIKIVGFDTSPTLVGDLNAGVIDSLVLQDPFQMGYQGLKTLLDYRSGRKTPRNIEFPPVLATRDNVTVASIRKLLSPDIGRYLR